jgi:hypothetical protein
MDSNKVKLKENELATSISSSMTVEQLKNELKKNNVDFSNVKKKAYYIDLYISNVMRKEVETLATNVTSATVGTNVATAATNVAAAATNVTSATDAVALKEELSKSLPKSVKKIPILEELIMSITIMGHGCEELVTPWPPQSEISIYFKNNVRVYSKSCVPDVNSIGNIYQNEDVLRHVQRKFSAVPKDETAAIVSAYADEVRDKYIRDVAISKLTKDPVSFTKNFDKLSDITNLARVSNLSTFLCNKNFSFYMDSEKERVNSIMRPVYNTLGIQLVDIRIKKTTMDGSVSYEQIFNPTDVKYIRFDLTNLNLIYKSGLTYILKEILKQKELVKPALEIFKFGKKDRIMDISLEQIYHFFQLIGVKYANIMDYTCRACSIGRLPQNLTDSIYRTEQKYRIKPVAFGKRTKSKRNKKTYSHKFRRNK